MLGGTVRGKRTSLRIPREEDLAAYARWMADLRVRRGGPIWGEPAMPATWKERFAEQAKDEKSVLWSIEADGALIGTTRVRFNWAPLGDALELGSFIVDPSAWRKGYGFDSALTLHRWAFDYLHLRYAEAAMPANNVAGARIATKLGYVEYAHGHDVHWQDGRHVDQVRLRMDLETWDERWGATEREYAALPETSQVVTASLRAAVTVLLLRRKAPQQMFGPRLEGKNGVALVPGTLDHFKLHGVWMAQPEVGRFWGPRFGNWTDARAEESTKKVAESTDEVFWTIAYEGEPVGLTGVDSIDWVARDGESFIFIGRHDLHRRGIASEAVRLRTDFAWRELRLHRVHNWIALANTGSRRANEKAGYRQIGLFERAWFRSGSWNHMWAGEIFAPDGAERAGEG